MSEKQTQPNSLPSTGSDFGSAIAEAISRAVNTPDELRGLHQTTRLEKPAVVSIFGKFKEELKYTRGCIISDEFSRGAKVLAFRFARPDGTPRVGVIGRTPTELDSRKGGTRELKDPNAGAPGDFLMAIQNPDGTDANFRYMDQADINGIMIRDHQEDQKLGQNLDRQRQLVVPGKIDLIVGYR
jgi:hypothetical protein